VQYPLKVNGNVNIGEGPCTFAPFRCRRQSKTNCHSRKSISHYSFWNFRSKTKSGSQVPLSVLAPKSKSRSWSSLFVLELLLPIRKAESFFHYSFWNFRSQNERRSCWSLTVMNGRAKSTSIWMGSAIYGIVESHFGIFHLEQRFQNG